MQTEVDLIRACLRLARNARQIGPATLAGAAAHWEMQFEERLVKLGAEPPKPRLRGRPRRVPAVVLLPGATEGGPVTSAPTQEAA